MPRQRKRSNKKSARKRSRAPRKKKRKRKHKTDVQSHARRRHARTRVHGHKKRMFKEAETMNYLLNQILKTSSASEDKPYNYHPRHHTKDPEYRHSSARAQRFKRGFPAPDVSMLRPQGDAEPTHRGNFPQWMHHPHEIPEDMNDYPFY